MKQYTRSIILALARVGDDVRTARIRRRLSQKDLAMNMGVSIGTVQRIERGDPGVSFGNVAMAFLVMDCLPKLETMLAPHIDEFGTILDRERMPQRVRSVHRATRTLNVSRTEPEPISY